MMSVTKGNDELAPERHLLLEDVESARAQPFGVVAQLRVAHEVRVGRLGDEERCRLERLERVFEVRESRATCRPR